MILRTVSAHFPSRRSKEELRIRSGNHKPQSNPDCGELCLESPCGVDVTMSSSFSLGWNAKILHFLFFSYSSQHKVSKSPTGCFPALWSLVKIHKSLWQVSDFFFFFLSGRGEGFTIKQKWYIPESLSWFWLWAVQRHSPPSKIITQKESLK